MLSRILIIIINYQLSNLQGEIEIENPLGSYLGRNSEKNIYVRNWDNFKRRALFTEQSIYIGFRLVYVLVWQHVNVLPYPEVSRNSQLY